MSSEKVCTSCGHEGHPIPQRVSSFLVDAMIWFYVLFLVAMSQQIWFLAVPLLWTIYHIVKFNSVKCPVCESLDMVSKDSRRGKAIMKNPNPVHIVYKKA